MEHLDCSWNTPDLIPHPWPLEHACDLKNQESTEYYLKTAEKRPKTRRVNLIGLDGHTFI